jgi:hypothetical protein
MIMNVPGVSNMVARINEELPPEIRLWGYVGLPSAAFLSFALRQSSRFESRTLLMPGCPFYSYTFLSLAAEDCLQNLR